MAPKRGKKVQKSAESTAETQSVDDPLLLTDEETPSTPKKTAKAARAGKTTQKGKNDVNNTEEAIESRRGADQTEESEEADEEPAENNSNDSSPKKSPGKKQLPPKEETKKTGRGAKKRIAGGEDDGSKPAKIARGQAENEENKSASGAGKTKRGKRAGAKKAAGGKVPAVGSRKSPRTNK